MTVSEVSRKRVLPLGQLMRPRSIAVIGASQNVGTIGHQIVKNLFEGGFTGKIYPVNPKYAGQLLLEVPEYQGVQKFLGSAQELPKGAIDLAVVVTPSTVVPTVLADLCKQDVKAVVVISAGFQEIGGDGRALADQLKAITEQNDVVLVGPNCLGIANTDPAIRMNATFAKEAPLIGKGAVFSQSGAVGMDIMNRAKRIGLGISQFVSLGNELQTGPEDILRYWQDDQTVQYVLGYMESGKALSQLRDLANTMTKSKPIILIKAGKSTAGARAARSHTGAMAGSDEVVNAMLVQTGIQRVDTQDELFAAAMAFENAVPSVGNRVALFSNAGGYGVMGSDLLDPKFLRNHGLVLATFTARTTVQLEALLPQTASKHDPVDTTATFPCEDWNRYEQALLAVVNDPQVDSCIVPLVPIMDIEPGEAAMIVSRVQRDTHKPVVAFISAGEDAMLKAQQQVVNAHLPPVAIYSTLEDAITGLGALEQFRRWQRRQENRYVSFDDVDRDYVQTLIRHLRAENRVLLTTAESLDILQAYCVPIARFNVAKTLDEVLSHAASMGYPVALKLNSQTITHKTDVGGVLVDIRNESELREAFAQIMQALEAYGVAEFKDGEGIMVQQFVKTGRELILGVSDDVNFGKVMLIGRGGIYTQVDKDMQLRLAPLSREDVDEMVTGLKAYQILKGYRGKPATDLEVLEETVLRLSQLITDFPEIQELDINPYLALPGSLAGYPGGMAVDGRIVLHPTPKAST